MADSSYKLTTAVFDLIMVMLTGGLWFFYMIFRYIRTH